MSKINYVITSLSNKTGSDLVDNLEHNAKGGYVSFNQFHAERAILKISQEFDSGELTFDEWKSLERRVGVLLNRLIEEGRWNPESSEYLKRHA